MYPSLQKLVRRHLAESKTLFVPQYQFGLAIEDALVRQEGGWAALTCAAPLQHAKKIARYQLTGEPLPPGGATFLAAEALSALPVDQRAALLVGGASAPSAGTAEALARLFGALRREGVTPEAYRRATTGLEGAPARQRDAQVRVFVEYERLLDQNEYVDAAVILKAATEAVRSGAWGVRQDIFAALGGLPLTALEKQFLEALQRHAAAFYLIGPPDERGSAAENESANTDAENADAGHLSNIAYSNSAYPSGTAARHLSAPFLYSEGGERPSVESSLKGGFSDEASPEEKSQLEVGPQPEAGSRPEEGSRGERSQTATPTARCRAAVGAHLEVREVFRDITRRELRFDEVEIAYTNADLYLTLIDGLAERTGIPITRSVGRPVGATRPGQALLGWLEWIQEGLSAPRLIQLLRSGLVRIDRVQNGAERKDGAERKHMTERKSRTGRNRAMTRRAAVA